jgi:hypothetical protein
LRRLEQAFDGRPDEQLRARDVELEEEERELRRAHQFFREDAHAGIDRNAEACRKMFEAAVARERLTFTAERPEVLATIAGFWFASRPEFVAALHEQLDRPTGGYKTSPFGDFTDMPRADFDAKVAAIRVERGEIRSELQRRALEQERAKTEADLRETEAALAAIGGSGE